MFVPPQCTPKSKCALLLANDFNTSNFVIDYITDLNLYVKVVWLGDNLKWVLSTLISRYQKRHNNKSLVFLTYIPSDIVLTEDDYYTVLFQHCEKSNTDITKRYLRT